MTKYAIEVNGRWFVVYADSLEAATTCATACMASILGCTTVGGSTLISRWEP